MELVGLDCSGWAKSAGPGAMVREGAHRRQPLGVVAELRVVRACQRVCVAPSSVLLREGRPGKIRRKEGKEGKEGEKGGRAERAKEEREGERG